MENRYLDIIIKIIASKSKEYSQSNTLSPAYFMNLLPEIKKSITIVINMYGYPEIDDVTLKNYFEIARKQYLSINSIDIEPDNELTREGFQTWLTEERKLQMTNSWNYSTRYFSYLESKGRPEKVISDTKASSLQILEKLGDPYSVSPFYYKGLVVGNVQAGKTENFNAVINRAIDVGYKLIIVLSGLMEDLRYQTQSRISSDIVGEGEDVDTGKIIDIGVGKIRKFGAQGDESIPQIFSVTSARTDFKSSLVDQGFSLNRYNILVCKKNVSVLRNLIVSLYNYLETNRDQHDIPFLILDDEADNASLNNEGKKGREYATKTNGHIRALLALFKRKTYLGYTATPFANILADRNEAPENNWAVKYKVRGLADEIQLPRVDNLFPDDFIVLLNPPSNYIGAKQIFEPSIPINNNSGFKIPLIEIVNDTIEQFPEKVYVTEDGFLKGVQKITNQDDWEEKIGEFNSFLEFSDYKDYKNKTRSTRPGDDFPQKLPDSLKESILCFVLAIAIRESRKPAIMYSTMFNPHNSMLIHISRYTIWQNRLKDLIEVYLKDLQSSIANDNPNVSSSIYGTFERIWFKYYANIIENITEFLPKGYEDKFLSPISFETIKNNYLTEAIKEIEIKAINSFTGDNLVYPKKTPKKYIAIGGNRLSRGFTLEGLSINYFVRSTDYSDALLQMGRWFGYRPGYIDCCKLFITSDLMDKYDLVTRTIDELETEFKKMEEKDKTPKNFVLRVKKHPGTLKITRPSILKDVLHVRWSYQDKLEQTAKFDISKQKIEKVFSAFKENVTSKYKFTPKINVEGIKSGFLITSTDINGILGVLKSENNFNRATCDSLIRFIELCKEKKKLYNWTIAIKTTGDANSSEAKGILSKHESGLEDSIQMLVRRGPREDKPALKKYRDDFINKKIFTASGKSANIISSGRDFSLLLNSIQIGEAEIAFIENRKKYYKAKYPDWTIDQLDKKANELNPPERIYREKMSDQDGLLVIYILDSHYVFCQEKGNEDPKIKELVERDGIDLNIPIIGYAIGFPPIEPDPGGVYVYGDYGIDEDDFDYNDADSELPVDANEI